jgi:hypothetical protein
MPGPISDQFQGPPDGRLPTWMDTVTIPRAQHEALADVANTVRHLAKYLSRPKASVAVARDHLKQVADRLRDAGVPPR